MSPGQRATEEQKAARKQARLDAERKASRELGRREAAEHPLTAEDIERIRPILRRSAARR